MIFRLFFLSLLSLSLYGAEYIVHDMGLGGEFYSKPTAINDLGDVVGIVKIDGEQKVFVWDHVEGKKILKYYVPKGCYPTCINNKKQIVGAFYVLEGWFDQKYVLHGFLRDDNGYKDLGAQDSKSTSAVCINDAGQVLLINATNQCYLWENGKVTKLEEASNVLQNSQLDYVHVRMNNTELVFTRQGPQEKMGPVLFKMDLKTKQCTRELESMKSSPLVTSISKNGRIGGLISTQGKIDGFIANNGEVTSVKDFEIAGVNEISAVGNIREQNRLVGGVFENGELKDINTLIPREKQSFPFESIISIRGVNNSGQMIGVASCWNTTKAVLLNRQ